MNKEYFVFSSNWMMRVEAASSYDAVLKATESKQKQFGELFSIAHVVAVVNSKGDFESYDSVAVLEDLGQYKLARELKIFINARK